MTQYMQLNAGLDAGECLVKSTDPNRIESTRVGELPIDADGADEASVPPPQIPTLVPVAGQLYVTLGTQSAPVRDQQPSFPWQQCPEKQLGKTQTG